MITRTFVSTLATAGIFGSALVWPAAGPLPDGAPRHVEAAGQQATVSGLDDKDDLAITVYNSDLALIRDTRTLRLQPGTGDLQFMDIAATVNPASVHFRSLTDASQLRVLEQNYEYDLLEPDKLLRKYVGRDVTLVRRRIENGQSIEDPMTAHLVSYNTAPVWRIGGEIVTGLSADHIRFPELPGNLFARPTLIWTLDNTGPSRQRVEASYLAGKLQWSADYVLTVGRDDRSADLDGWVTVVNGSGTAFRNARLQLVAGELHRVRAAMQRVLADTARGALAESAAPQMSEESFSDYHLYTLQRKTTINTNETKQVSMLNASGFPVRKRYVVDGQPWYYRTASPGAAAKEPVQVFFELKNEQKAGLGLPLPAGTVRVYQADSRGGVLFVGEDRIGHTPRDERLSLKVGHAFDVTAERRQTDFQRVSSNAYEFEYEITLRNHKATPINVEVNEPIGGSWRMLRASADWQKTGAFAARFDVPVAVDGTVVLTYRVRATN